MRSKHKTLIVRPVLSCMLTVCLIAGMMVFAEPVYGGAEFTTTAPFSNTGYSTYYHNGKYSGNLLVNGVDVSYFNSKKSNWVTAKSKGVDFAIMRVSFTYYGPKTLTTDYDSKFKTHFANAKAAGVMKGVYVFSQAKSAAEARKEAQYALKLLGEYGITPKDLELPVYMDYEYAGSSSSGRLYGINKTTATAAARAFCDEIRKAGFTPGIYACTSFFRSNIDASKLEKDIDLWCAQYYSRNQSDVNYSKWQYTSTGKISGILSTSDDKSVGYVDCNYWYINKNPNKSAIVEIYGVTDFNYTGSLIKPHFELYDGTKLLKEGTDYIIGGIRNIAKSSSGAYAYIKGIGSYAGYALVPITIDSGFAAHTGLNNCKDSAGRLIFGNAFKTKDVTSYLVKFVNEDGEEITSAYYEEGTAADAVAVPEAPVKAEDDEFTYEFAGWRSVNGEGIAQVTEAVTYFPEFTSTAKEPVVTEEAADPAETGETAQPEEPAVVNENEEVVQEESAESEEPVVQPEADLSEGSADHESGDDVITVEEDTRPGSVTETVVTNETVYDLNIGTSSYGGYVRNIPAGLTVDELLSGLAFREGYDGYSLAVISNKGVKRSGDTAVKTGMMLAVYKGSTLVGTADLTVLGDTINTRAANYLGRGTALAAAPAAVTTVKSTASKVTVPKASFKSLKARKKGFYVKVKRLSKSQVTGYQVRYSLKPNMSGAAIRNIGTTYKKDYKSIYKLKRKKYYYVQVRSYRKVNGKTYYSAWSSARKVRTK